MSEPTTMTTYRQADGEPVHGEFDWVADTDGWWDDADDPVEVIEQVWVLSSTRTLTFGPKCPECDEPATHWGLCEAHAREDDPEAFEKEDTHG